MKNKFYPGEKASHFHHICIFNKSTFFSTTDYLRTEKQAIESRFAKS